MKAIITKKEVKVWFDSLPSDYSFDAYSTIAYGFFYDLLKGAKMLDKESLVIDKRNCNIFDKESQKEIVSMDNEAIEYIKKIDKKIGKLFNPSKFSQYIRKEQIK